MAESAREDAEKAAQSIIAALNRAWNAHDAEAWAAEFQRDASFTNVFGIEILGRAEIARTHRHIFTTMFRDSRAEFDAPHVRPLRPDVASVAVRWRMSGAYDVHGQPWSDREGLMHLVITADTAGWKIAIGTNMDLPPQPRMVEMQRELAKDGRNGMANASGMSQQ